MSGRRDVSRAERSGGKGAAGARTLWANLIHDFPVVPTLDAHSVAMQEYRNLALKVEEELIERSARGGVIAVTSPDARSGKTLTSMNLALLLSRKGERRVLLVEGDIWRPGLQGLIRLEEIPPGLVGVLKSDSPQTYKQSLVSLWGEGVEILPTGGDSTSNPDLITSPRMVSLLDILRKHYDFVVIDCPPFPLASAKFLASKADGVLVVLRANRTKRKEVDQVLADLDQRSVLGLVFNAAVSSQGQYSSYSAYASKSSKRWKGRLKD
jgi:non-specific protein-tyrosine kinase